ncbi:MAG: hypothetical protein ACOZCO_16700 [Bacteroidota bacterium]
MDFENFNDDLTPEEREEQEKAFREKQEKIKKHPLRKKAHEIFKTIHSMLSGMDEQGKEMVGHRMLESAMIIEAKLAGALGSDMWLICMQNAAIVRQYASELLISNHSLEMFTETDESYIRLFRKDMEEFRELFKEWVTSFEKLDRSEYEDEWGLFIRK